jgi:hypothetical protein
VSPDEIAAIDRCLREWRQGDVVIGSALSFVHVADLDAPSTPAAEALLATRGNGERFFYVSVDIEGFVVLSQTCDIVRSCAKRPYVEVCPLVTVGSDQIGHLQSGRLGRFAALPALENRAAAADLERVMTVEKGLLAQLDGSRRSGVTTAAQIRIFAETLARKRSRAAFPDSLVAALQRMQRRIQSAHDQANAMGNFLRATREIRVQIDPAGGGDGLILKLLFVFDGEANIPTDAQELVDELTSLVTRDATIDDIEARPVSLDSLSAATYLATDRLDLDHISLSSD